MEGENHYEQNLQMHTRQTYNFGLTAREPEADNPTLAQCWIHIPPILLKTESLNLLAQSAFNI